MSRILSVLLLMLALAVPAYAESGSGSKLLLHSLLTSDNRNFVLMGAREVFRNPGADPAAMEIVAELLCERTAAPTRDALDLDTTAWFIKGLGASKSERYREVISKAVAAYADPKVSIWGERSLAELSLPSADRCAAGTVSLDRLRAELAAERVSSAGQAAGKISSISPNQSLDSVIATLGYPDNLIETVAVRGHAYVKIRSRSLQLQYFGRGQINIDNHFEAGTGWTATTTWPDIPNQAPAYAGPQPVDAYLLMTSDALALQDLAASMLARHETDPAMLDRVADRVRLSLDPPGPTLAMIRLIRLLGECGNPRYVDVLELVEGTSRDNDIKHEAKVALESLRGISAAAPSIAR